VFGMSCPNPIDPGVLADYWLAELPEAEERALEEHLFSCEDCTRQLQSMVQLGQGIRTLAEQGNLPLIVAQDFLDRLTRQGFRTREYSVSAGGRVECTVTPQDDFLIGRMAANLRDVERLDLAMCEPSGKERLRLRDIPFRADSTEVILNYPVGPARRSGPDLLVMKLLAVTGQDERMLGEYTFNHTPS
jgi:hypothetical protein